MAAVRSTARCTAFNPAVILLALLVFGCTGDGGVVPGPTELSAIGELTRFCFSDTVDCGDYRADVLLRLNTGNLPSHNPGSHCLVLTCQPRPAGEIIGYIFEGELDPQVDPGIEFQSGWKAQIQGARIAYCEDCYTNGGLAQIIHLHGDLQQVSFIQDASDSLETYVRAYRAKQGSP